MNTTLMLIFKKRGKHLICHINGEKNKAVSSYNPPKDAVCLTAPKKWDLKPNTLYKCDVEFKNGRYKFISAKKVKMNVSVEYHSSKIVVRVGSKKIFLDPVNGASPYSRTLEGAIRAVNMLPDNFDKDRVINELKFYSSLM